MKINSGITLRPYQVLSVICALGEKNPRKIDPKIQRVMKTIRNNPDIPLTLRCNAGDVFVYQDPGPAENMRGSLEYNIKCDLEILYKLNLFPGCTLPARIIFNRAFDAIDDLSIVCGPATSAAWKGYSKECRAAYKRGHKKGIAALIPPRPAEEMEMEKKASLEAMYKAKSIKVRPHILLCAVCQYGGGLRPPFPEDNLPELIQLALKKPDTLITMAPHADWMMCAPCPSRSVKLNGCICNRGSGGLPNDMRDLRVLQKLGLTFGSTLNFRDLYKRIFKRIPGTLAICRIEHSKPSVWFTGCGVLTTDNPPYKKGRKLLMAKLK